MSNMKQYIVGLLLGLVIGVIALVYQQVMLGFWGGLLTGGALIAIDREKKRLQEEAK